jgi:hypothetical protein
MKAAKAEIAAARPGTQTPPELRRAKRQPSRFSRRQNDRNPVFYFRTEAGGKSQDPINGVSALVCFLFAPALSEALRP